VHVAHETEEVQPLVQRGWLNALAWLHGLDAAAAAVQALCCATQVVVASHKVGSTRLQAHNAALAFLVYEQAVAAYAACQERNAAHQARNAALQPLVPTALTLLAVQHHAAPATAAFAVAEVLLTNEAWYLQHAASLMAARQRGSGALWHERWQQWQFPDHHGLQHSPAPLGQHWLSAKARMWWKIVCNASTLQQHWKQRPWERCAANTCVRLAQFCACIQVSVWLVKPREKVL
jgi:hypothetical protein